MAQSLIPFPPTNPANVPNSRRWIAFRVIHKAGGPSWAVVDASTYELHPEASAYLHYLMGSSRSTNTIRAYAQRLATFFTWLGPARLDWRDGVPVVSRFIRELAVSALSAPGGTGEYREPRYRRGKTMNQYAAAITQFYMWAARSDLVSEKTAAGFYETRIAYGFSGDRLLPGQVSRARAVRVKEVEEAPKLIGEPAVESLLGSIANRRDRFLVALMLETGVRIGEAMGLRTEDLHLFHDSRALKCASAGPHIHIRRRQNPNAALSKSSKPRTVPVTEAICTLYYLYLEDRIDRLAHDPSPMVFVNLYSRAHAGEALKYSNAVKMFYRTSGRAGLRVNPHMTRHTAATRWKRAGVPARDVQELLGHRSAASQLVYEHATDQDLRDAIEGVRFGTPRPS
ncbi:tyrosine-type recombinase/integrase [Arthrobacter sp. KBS0703]|uniref:tyrosine-type recombinase/integrase n=1 Tax=Arthrobacter sp. KBS0703 TaxID=1955698 RepID=UPI0009900E9F|nr:tyrosine-type recombinase/integrase [Arthrobacter sp. KBS0703]TSE15768.1 tyrosine-type recombinase/integrase [Arthrobacter sp. KBS0703]